MDSVDYNPVVEMIDFPITLEDKIKESGNHLISYLEYKNKEFIRHIYACRTTKKKGFECMEIFREYESGEQYGKNFYYISYGVGAGLHIIWKKTQSFVYGNYERIEKFQEYNDNHWNIGMFNVHQLTTFEDIVVHDLSLRYCKWNKNVDALNYIKQYKKHPIVEMLMKLELYHLVFNEKCILFMEDNKSFCKWLYKNKDSIKNDKIAFQSLKVAFSKGYDVSAYNSKIIDKRTKGRECSNLIGKKLYKIFKGSKYIDKALKYIPKVGQYNYQDYLEACKYFKLDLNDTKVLFPNDFMHWHDYYINQMKISINKEIDKSILKQTKKYKFLLIDLEKLTLMFPTSTQDFIDEGEALHHCVGRMGYNKKMANGESLIIFVRKKEKPNIPFITMEYDQKLKEIKQLYTDHDNTPEEEYKNIMYNQWLPMVRKLSKGGRNNEKQRCVRNII